MNQKMLHEVSKRHQINEHRLRKALIAFVSGGFVSLMAQFVNDLLLLVYSKENASILTVLIFILFAGILTGLGLYDKMASVAGAGLFVPITGFSNSLASSALECKREGPIYGIGSNMFKLAGSVITYGIVSAILFALIAYGVKKI